jgi:hypothetical protein
VDGTILGPSCGNDRVDVLTREGCGVSRCARQKAGMLTFDLGGLGFGLQAFLTTFSKEDIVSRDEPESDSGVGEDKRHHCMTKTFLLWHQASQWQALWQLVPRSLASTPHSLPQKNSAESSNSICRDRGRLLLFAPASPTSLCHDWPQCERRHSTGRESHNRGVPEPFANVNSASPARQTYQELVKFNKCVWYCVALSSN